MRARVFVTFEAVGIRPHWAIVTDALHTGFAG